VTENEFHRQFNTNVLGLILATQEAVKHFGTEGGSVINIGSVASDLTPPTAVIYGATKGAVDAITRVLAKELGPKKIRVNSINPGGVETEGFHAGGFSGTDFEKQMVAQTPLGRMGQPRDIAPAAVFLASSDAAWITAKRCVLRAVSADGDGHDRKQSCVNHRCFLRHRPADSPTTGRARSARIRDGKGPESRRFHRQGRVRTHGCHR